ncbi:MAG: ABC transporter ATP-binding protein/permease [Clostridiales bacterium]|nr:ABC transporter ATP-binding protein/permease [Clostridiales bacterium]
MKKTNFIGRPVGEVLRREWLLTALLAVFIVVSMFLHILPAFILRKIIDENFAQGLMSGVWLLAVWYLLVMAAGNVSEFLKVIITTALGQKILNRLRLLMSKRLSELSMRYFVKTPVGDAMSRLTTDVDAINTLFSAGVIGVITDLFKIGGLIVSLWVIAPQLVWLWLVAAPLIFLLANYFRKNLFQFEKKVRACVSDIYTFIQEWLRGVKTVKAYGLEKDGERRFRAPLNRHLAAVNGISRYDSWFPCVMQVFKALLIALSLWFGAQNGTILSLGLSIGALAAVCDLVSRLFAPIEALATEFQTIQEAMAGIARVREFMEEPVEERRYAEQAINESRGIEIEGVSFAYENAKVLDDVTVRLEPGEKAVFIGRSGAGKTTLMNIVAGLYAPAAGTVRLCGVNPYTLPPSQRRRLLGVVPQDPQVFDGTVSENITLNDPSITQAQVEAAVKAVGLHEAVTRLPRGYDTKLGEGEAGLSGGEEQLLSLARAIAANPKILLLDEPTSGMDSQTEQRVFAAIRAAGQGRTIFSISHRISGIVDAERVHLLSHGRIVESGTAEELAERESWYSMYRKIESAGWKFA